MKWSLFDEIENTLGSENNHVTPLQALLIEKLGISIKTTTKSLGDRYDSGFYTKFERFNDDISIHVGRNALFYSKYSTNERLTVKYGSHAIFINPNKGIYFAENNEIHFYDRDSLTYAAECGYNDFTRLDESFFKSDGISPDETKTVANEEEMVTCLLKIANGEELIEKENKEKNGEGLGSI